jgi:hypothetical protein
MYLKEMVTLFQIIQEYIALRKQFRLAGKENVK